jgi:hypothetical protein
MHKIPLKKQGINATQHNQAQQLMFVSLNKKLN